MVPPLAAMIWSPMAGGQATPDAGRVTSVPHPEEVGARELLTVTPLGRVSVKEKLVNDVSGGAVKVSLNLEFAPGAIVVGKKVFVAVMPAPMV